MAEHARPLTPTELEHALTDLGAHLAYPPTPNLARSVRLRLAAEPARRPSRLPWPAFLTNLTDPSPRRAVALGFVALLLLLVAARLWVGPQPQASVEPEDRDPQ